MIIKNMNTLKAMERRKLIELTSDTKKFGYVNDGKINFEFNGSKYKIKFFDGCFYPFVIKVN